MTKFMFTPARSAAGTSFHDVMIRASFRQLAKVFGPPHEQGGDKTHVEWAFQTGEGQVFTLYDWKEAFNPEKRPDVEYRWHVGAAGYYQDPAAVKLCLRVRDWFHEQDGAKR